MKPINLRKIDLNLLTVFEAVYEEKSQQRASERLFMTQPAISNAISRLRHLVDDRLFYGGRVIQTTTTADALYLEVHRALEIIRQEFQNQAAFNPKSTRRTFTIAMGYGSGYLLGPPLFKMFEEEAPEARLVIRSIDPQTEIPRLLREQALDLAFTNRRFQDQNLEVVYGIDFELVVVAREGHPTLNQDPTLQELETHDYLWVHDSSHQSELSEFQDFMRMAEARAKMEVPNALMVPVMLKNSNLIAFLPKAYLDPINAPTGLKYFKLPIQQLTNHSLLTWHRAYEEDPAIQWFRDLALRLTTPYQGNSLKPLA